MALIDGSLSQFINGSVNTFESSSVVDLDLSNPDMQGDLIKANLWNIIASELKAVENKLCSSSTATTNNSGSVLLNNLQGKSIENTFYWKGLGTATTGITVAADVEYYDFTFNLPLSGNVLVDTELISTNNYNAPNCIFTIETSSSLKTSYQTTNRVPKVEVRSFTNAFGSCSIGLRLSSTNYPTTGTQTSSHVYAGNYYIKALYSATIG